MPKYPSAHRPTERTRKSATLEKTKTQEAVGVRLLTDPWSVWCWGWEPARRTIELRYPSIKYEPILGGMFPQMPDHERAGFDVDRFFQVVERTTGMPARFQPLRNDPAESTYPACIHVHAVRLLAPERERAYLRALREAVYLDGLNVSRTRVGARVAGRIGIDPEAFKDVRENGKAEAAFDETMQQLHAQNLLAYPTLLVGVGPRTTRVEGYQSLPALLGLAQSMTGRVLAPTPDPPIEDVIGLHERVLTREVAEALGVTMEIAIERLEGAVDDSVLERSRFPGGDAWSRVPENPMVRTK